MSSVDLGVPGAGVALAPRRAFPWKLAGVAVIVLAVGYLVLTGLSSATVYYLTVGEYQAQQAQLAQQNAATGTRGGRAVRVSGNVVPGTIVREGTTVRFTMADPSGSLPVVYKGVVPDIFGDDAQVVVEGRSGPDGAFHASNLLAKCPSKFEAAPALQAI
ncbi:MAG: cytochrome c maturation protein CcmE [Chloroflexi bacterium]|nr:cytochrome c maturation protein CcmE [Chloroflexota bacterium]